MRVLAVILAVLLLCPSWSGEERLPLYDGTPRVGVSRVALGPGGVRRVGRLTYLGGLRFRSGDPAFGGFSSIATDGRRFELLSDGGLSFTFAMAPAMRPYRPRFGTLPAGPGSGWRKLDRDSESQAIDPTTGRIWVAFERHNAIWRYAPAFARAEGAVRPAAMRAWPLNSGPEAMVRLASGGFLVFSEGQGVAGGGYQALAFARDPVEAPSPSFAFAYVPPSGYRPTDAAELPGGDILVLNRRLHLPQGFTAKLVRLPRAAVRANARVAGEEIATLEPPLIHDNFEGLAVTREGAATILWLVSDDNMSWFQRTLLLKFRLAPTPSRERPAPPGGGTGRSGEP